MLGVELDRGGACLGALGTRSPLAASIRQPPSWRWRTAAPSSPRTPRRPSSTAEAGDEPARRESASASARARAPSAARRAASATKLLTIAPTVRKTKSASTSSASRMVSVWWGSMKNQLTSRKPLIAAARPGPSPPTAATMTISSRKRSITLGSSSGSRSRVSSSVKRGSPAAPSSDAERLSPARERGGAARSRDDVGVLGAGLGVADDVDVDRGARVADHSADHGAAREPLPAGAPGRAHHDLGRVQRAGGVEEGLADVGAGDLVVGAAQLFDELVLLREQLRRGAERPSCGTTWMATRSPFERCAMRAARRTSRSPSAEPVRATSTRSRVSQGCSIPWRLRYSASPSSTRSASQASASSRRAARLPGRK